MLRKEIHFGGIELSQNTDISSMVVLPCYSTTVLLADDLVEVNVCVLTLLTHADLHLWNYHKQQTFTWWCRKLFPYLHYIDHKWESKVLEMSSHKLIPPAIIDLAKYVHTSTRSNATYHIPGHIYILVISSILEPKTRLVL